MKARLFAPANRKWWTLAAVAFGRFRGYAVSFAARVNVPVGVLAIAGSFLTFRE